MTKDDDRPQEPRRLKVTDKRRVRDDPSAEASSSAPADGDEARSPESPPQEGRSEAQGAGEVDAEARAAEYLEHLQRVKAEYDNYRKRILREQTRAVEFATEGLMVRLLEVLDEFELALGAAEQEEEASERYVHGVHMVYAKLLDLLKAEGLERIDAAGRPFDPALHEALLQGDGPEDGEPYVADVLRTGYRLKGRVVRPAGVKVARR
jgi:molecular chaperone GrpE